jgi:hypothetical protein
MCVQLQGYWKTHGPLNKVKPPTNPPTYEANTVDYTWPLSVQSGGLVLGTLPYTADQLWFILMNNPNSGDALLILAHQLIAVKINIAKGAESNADILAAVASADTLIGSLAVPTTGSGDLPTPLRASALLIKDTLVAYNEGSTGPGAC